MPLDPLSTLWDIGTSIWGIIEGKEASEEQERLRKLGITQLSEELGRFPALKNAVFQIFGQQQRILTGETGRSLYQAFKENEAAFAKSGFSGAGALQEAYGNVRGSIYDAFAGKEFGARKESEAELTELESWKRQLRTQRAAMGGFTGSPEDVLAQQVHPKPTGGQGAFLGQAKDNVEMAQWVNSYARFAQFWKEEYGGRPPSIEQWERGEYQPYSTQSFFGGRGMTGGGQAPYAGYAPPAVTEPGSTVPGGPTTPTVPGQPEQPISGGWPGVIGTIGGTIIGQLPQQPTQPSPSPEIPGGWRGIIPFIGNIIGGGGKTPTQPETPEGPRFPGQFDDPEKEREYIAFTEDWTRRFPNINPPTTGDWLAGNWKYPEITSPQPTEDPLRKQYEQELARWKTDYPDFTPPTFEDYRTGNFKRPESVKPWEPQKDQEPYDWNAYQEFKSQYGEVFGAAPPEYSAWKQGDYPGAGDDIGALLWRKRNPGTTIGEGTQPIVGGGFTLSPYGTLIAETQPTEQQKADIASYKTVKSAWTAGGLDVNKLPSYNDWLTGGKKSIWEMTQTPQSATEKIATGPVTPVTMSQEEFNRKYSSVQGNWWEEYGLMADIGNNSLYEQLKKGFLSKGVKI